MPKQIQMQKQTYVEEEEEELDPREKLKKWLERVKKLGIVLTYSYHCIRCNHVWFPKEFDTIFENAFLTTDQIVNYPTPKACARCKSKYWNSPPKRKTKRTSKLTNEVNVNEIRSLTGSEKMELFGHDMLTLERSKSISRRLIKAKEAMANIRKIDEDAGRNGFDEKRVKELIYNIKKLDPRSQRTILKKYGIDVDK